ncbi:MAG: Tn3 family transposase, partial [Solirubrobacteraceae bacterium]
MARDLGLDDVVDHFTLIGDELDQLRNKSGATRLGFAVLLKFLLWRGRFPRGLHEVPEDAVAHLARQVRVPATELEAFDFASRTAKRHRTEIRVYTGFRECSVADAEALTGWLAEHVASGERRPERVRDELIARCRAELIEPPTPERVSEIARSALYQAEQAMLALIPERVDPAIVVRLEALIAVSDDDEENLLGLIKAAPGNVSLETMLVEISKLEAIRAIGLPTGLFTGIDARIVAGWRARAAVESPVHLREHPQPTKLALLCALLYLREREVTDALAQLLISTVHRINARSEDKVITELVKDFKRVTGKETLLRKIAEASLGTPDDTVREVIFPVVGGEATLKDLVAEFRQKGTEYQRQKRKVFKASYSNHYRRGLIRLLGVLEFRSNNKAHQPIIDALALIARYAHATGQYYPAGEHVIIKGAVDPIWADLLTSVDSRKQTRVIRHVYEACVFQALRERLRCKEIWVVGAHEWRNPDEDLPTDFETRRVEHYDKLHKPLDPAAFTATLRDEMRGQLAALDDALPGLDWLRITNRKSGAIKLTPLAPQRDPRNLRRLKKAIRERWGQVPLIDIVTEAALRTGMLGQLTAVGPREVLARAVLWERLLLLAYAYGTNTGISAVAAGDHGHSEADLRYTARRHFTIDGARAVAIQLANATFAARDPAIWGESTTTVASDSTHFRAYDQNLFTEWHSRYGGRGVLIYWHIEKKSMAVHSQLLSCAASE